jgi:ribosomal protein S18 acetylase RimI-like enzyme
MQISYRKLIPGDEKSYRILRLECLKNFPDQFGSRYDEEAKAPKLKFETFIENQSTDNFMFGAFADDRNLIGIAGFSRGDREKTKHRGEVVQMYVDPKFGRQGIGDTLLRELIRAAFGANDIESLELSVVADNPSAVRLYEKVGFKVYCLRKNYFKDGDRYWKQMFMELLWKDFYENRF